MRNFPFFFWLRIGLLSFGGPAAQIALLEQECVEKKKWLTHEEFSRALGLCMFLPGPEAQQLVAWIGWKLYGNRGAIFSTILFILPGLIACGIFAWIYALTSQVPVVGGILEGARAALAGIIIMAGYKMFQRTCTTQAQRFAMGGSLVALFLSVPFAILALGNGLLGWFMPKNEEETESESPSENLKQTLNKLGKFLLPVLGLYLLLWIIFKHHHAVVQLAETSLIAVLASFGGAYSALGIWRNHADHHSWIPAQRFGDALIVGEATPGPLLLSASFIGFLVGFEGHLFSGCTGPLWGILGLGIVTLFTFATSTLILLASASLADTGLGSRQLHRTFGMVGATATAAIFFLGISLLLDLYKSPHTHLYLVAFATGYLFYKQKLSVPALIGIGAVIGLFNSRL
jgi:chromate transporter